MSLRQIKNSFGVLLISSVGFAAVDKLEYETDLNRILEGTRQLVDERQNVAEGSRRDQELLKNVGELNVKFVKTRDILFQLESVTDPQLKTDLNAVVQQNIAEMKATLEDVR